MQTPDDTSDTDATLSMLADLSREFGYFEYVLGGGGNSSFKLGRTLWIKPSGCTLADLTQDSFVRIDRDALSRLYALHPPEDVSQREEVVKQTMLAARAAGQQGRPSVETPLHDALDAAWVMHTHPPLVNAMTCGRLGRQIASDLFPEALWVPYIDPGYTLSMAVRRKLQEWKARTGRQPNIIFLENHGVFVAGDDPAEIRRHYAQIMTQLTQWCRDHDVDRSRPPIRLISNVDDCEHHQKQIDEAFGRPMHTLIAERFEVPAGPLTPDHMVYAKAEPMNGPVNAENLKAYLTRCGFLPRILQTTHHTIAAADSPRAARLAMDLAVDGAWVITMSRAFGGPQFMTDQARRFIESWEVESYREKVATASSTT